MAVDTAPFIYFIEDHPKYAAELAQFFALVDGGQIRCVTSVITFLEVLVHPLRTGHNELAATYRDILLNAANVVTVPMGSAIADRAASLRATYNFRTPDAIQLATAAQLGASAFITNDTGARRFGGLQVILMDEICQASP